MASHRILMNLCFLLVILVFVTVEAAPRNRRHLGAIVDSILGAASYGYGTPYGYEYGAYGTGYGPYGSGYDGYDGYGAGYGGYDGDY